MTTRPKWLDQIATDPEVAHFIDVDWIAGMFDDLTHALGVAIAAMDIVSNGSAPGYMRELLERYENGPGVA